MKTSLLSALALGAGLFGADGNAWADAPAAPKEADDRKKEDNQEM